MKNLIKGALDTLMGFNIIDPTQLNPNGRHSELDADVYEHKDTGERLTKDEAKKRGLKAKWIIDKGGKKQKVWVSKSKSK